MSKIKLKIYSSRLVKSSDPNADKTPFYFLAKDDSLAKRYANKLWDARGDLFSEPERVGTMKIEEEKLQFQDYRPDQLREGIAVLRLGKLEQVWVGSIS